MTNNKNPEVIIITDMYGNKDVEWLKHYVKAFSKNYKVTVFDAIELAGLYPKNNDQNSLHDQFKNGGIDQSVENLNKMTTHKVYVTVGFSIGGLIAWKAALAGLQTEKLMTFSSTRLRYENQKPSSDLYLVYGENDKYKPVESWFNSLSLNHDTIANQGHEFYKNKETIPYLIQYINNQL